MRHPETSPAIDRARNSRTHRKPWGRALGAFAALLIGASALAAQETPPTDLRPAAPTTPEQPAVSTQTSPRVLTAPTPAQPSEPAQTTPAPAQPATPPATLPSVQAAPAAAPAVPTATETTPAAQPLAAPSGSPDSGATGGEPTAAPPVRGSAEPVAAPVSSVAGEALVPETAGTATLPHDLSPWGMFMAADIIVKSVMLGLAFASVVTWTIWLAKALELLAARMKARRALRCLERATTLQEAVEAGRRWPKRGPVAALAQAALLETSRSGGLGAEGVKDRAAVALHRIEARAGRSMSRGTGLLATIGSTAPFVGLFGTVWGIMNSFIGISKANTTNLAVVAPGIAEALLATAIGLVAAIPAVIIYNVFARSIAGYRAVLADASAEVLRHLSRDLDRRDLRIEPGSSRGILQAAE